MATAVEPRAVRRRRHWRWSAYLTGAFFLAILSWPTAEESEEGGAYAFGAFVGSLAVPLGIALVLRFLYVKLIRRDGRSIWSPWIFAIAVPLALAGNAGPVNEQS